MFLWMQTSQHCGGGEHGVNSGAACAGRQSVLSDEDTQQAKPLSDPKVPKNLADGQAAHQVALSQFLGYPF